MKLQSISFSREDFTEKSFWKYNNLEFDDINLIVGQNASGKTRITRTIFALSELITYNTIPTFTNVKFHWNAKFKSDEYGIYNYEVIYQNNRVLLEKLFLNEEELIVRDNSGKGKIKSLNLNSYLDFEVDVGVLIVFNKKDKIHHPFLIELSQWAENLSYFSFGAPLGQNTNALTINNDISKKTLQNQKKIKIETSDKTFIKKDIYVVSKFQLGMQYIGEKFKKSIIEDINSLGYNVTDIELRNAPNQPTDGNISTICLYIQENSKAFIPQIHISQGMFRALSILIQITFNKYLPTHTSLIIDDIGEGLDYERSTNLINLLIDKVENTPDKQLFLTSNDRYVMNSIPLKYWNIIYSENSEIKCKNIKNSPEIFEDFSFTGLNNFDLFTWKIFQEDSLIEESK
jgi:AAA15 family ATPase/GTPase